MCVCMCVCVVGKGMDDGCVVVCVHVWVCMRGVCVYVGVCGEEQGGQERKSMRSDSHSAGSGTTIYQI